MKAKFKLFVPLVLVCTLFFGSMSFAMSSTGVSLTNVQRLNQLYIDTWNDLSISDKKELLYQLEPTFLNKLGLKTYLPFETLAQKYQSMYDANLLPDSAKDSNGDYYPNYGEFLLSHTGSNSGYLTYDRYASDVTVDVVNSLADDEIVNSGSSYFELYSYKNINTSTVWNLNVYNALISSCDSVADQYDYFVIQKQALNGSDYLRVFCIPKDCVVYGSNNVLHFANNSNANFTAKTFTILKSNASVTTSNYTVNKSTNLDIGTPSYISYSVDYNKGWNGGSVFTTKSDKSNILIFDSYNSYINHNGHFEPTFQFFSNWGRVPTVSMDSHDFTQTYNNIVSGSNNVTDSNNTTTNIYYPGSYNPDSNSYDPDTHKLDFSGVGALLASIGDLIGSLINGIAQGLANIVSSIASVVHNLVDVFTSGNVFEFLKIFMSWLPEPIPTLLIAFFSLSVLFAVIRLVKGALS